MNQVVLAEVVTFISGLFTLAGVAGVTSADISGFVNVIFGFITLAGIVWAHFAHKQAVIAAANPVQG